jgi:hypothetical protein
MIKIDELKGRINLNKKIVFGLEVFSLGKNTRENIPFILTINPLNTSILLAASYSSAENVMIKSTVANEVDLFLLEIKYPILFSSPAN